MSIIDVSTKNKYVFTGEYNLFDKELKRCKTLILNQMAETNNSDFCYYNTIFINGSRGTGKTSFLNSLLCEIHNEEPFNKDIECLDYLDPTLIEDKANIFLTILSLIQTKVLKKIEDVSDENIKFSKKKTWEMFLEKLSDGLPLLSPANSSTSFWDDSVHIMNKGLKDTKATFDLRKNFDLFLTESLGILNKKYFLLTIDDVDTDPKKAWPLLEFLRKYLCLNKLIIILSGDIKLFETIVRENQWEQFRAISSKEPTQKDFLIHQISNLQDQYLRKILPLKNRIKLPSLNEMYLKEIMIFDIPFSEYIRILFGLFGINNSSIQKGYQEFLLKQSLRTQIDFYRLFGNIIDKEYSIIPNDFITNVYYVFENELEEYNIDLVDVLSKESILSTKVLQMLIDNNLIDECYQLQPLTSNNSLNACLFVISLIYTIKFRLNIKQAFEYFIKIAYIRNLSTLSSSLSPRRYISYNSESMISFAGINTNIDLRQACCYITAYLRQYYPDNKGASGILTIRRFSKMAKKNIAENIGSFDYELENAQISNLLKCVACLPLSVSSYQNVNKTVNEYSFFTLICSIFDLISEFESGNSISKVLPRMSQIKEYPIPSEFSGNEEEEVFETNSFLSENNTGWYNFEEQFRTWLSYSKSLHIYIPPYLIGKICTRIFFSFSNIVKNIIQINSLGEVMHLFVSELFHATIIEEFTEQSTSNTAMWNDIYIQNNNISSTDKVFLDNLEKILPVIPHDYLPLTKIILTCPIFMYFYHFDEKSNILKHFYNIMDSKLERNIENRFSYKIPSNFIEYFENENLYETLSKITLKEKNTATQDKYSLTNIETMTYTGNNISETEIINHLKKYLTKEQVLEMSITELKLYFKDITNTPKSLSIKLKKIKEFLKENPSLW